MAKELRGYAAAISKATGATDEKTLAAIEDTMRHVIFHSTLDWQTSREFNKGAREAYGIVRLKQRGASPILTAEDDVTARLLGIDVRDVPNLAGEAA